MLPALVILWLAWTLGSEFKALGISETMGSWLQGSMGANWLPLTVFLLAAAVSFTTGSSWGTMGIFMPLALPLALTLSNDPVILSYVIGAVFGGAVFGDHCSPFSDTTVVSSLSAGCIMTSHVSTQLPYALIAAAFSAVAYLLMALQIPSLLALAICLVGLAAMVIILTRNK